MISATHLHKRFGDKVAVDDLSLHVAAGEAYGLVGPDGAGKTTTMRLLVGALAVDRGEVMIAGHDLLRHPEQAHAELGYLSQRFSLYSDLTVTENLRFFGEMRGISGPRGRARADELLRFVGLDGFGGRLAGQLSGGMKQKLGLAQALIHQPRVLLLDEPTGGVDPIARQDFWQLLIRLLGEGLALLVTTPYMDEAVRCHRVGFMEGGRLLVEGAPSAITAPLAGQMLELSATPLREARHIAQADPAVTDAVPFGDRLHLRSRDPAATLARLPNALADAGIRVIHLKRVPPTLEDAFIALLENGQWTIEHDDIAHP